jgi:hypothetical protein
MYVILKYGHKEKGLIKQRNYAIYNSPDPILHKTADAPQANYPN